MDPERADLHAIESRFADLLRHPDIEPLRELLRGYDCHLVGGILRDAALDRPRRDIDIVVAGEGKWIADHLADKLGGRTVQLGGQRWAAYRVTAALPIDIWDRGSTPLEDDLRRRDLTIHAVALDLRTGAIADPFAGLADLSRGRLRMTTTSSFAEDPLRVLRLCRYAGQLEGFTIDPATRERAGAAVAALDRVASERIRDEVAATLSRSDGRVGVSWWLRLCILPDWLLDSPLPSQSRHRLQAGLRVWWSSFDRTAESLPAVGDLTTARLALVLALLESHQVCPASEGLALLRARGFVTRVAEREVARRLALGPIPSTEARQRWFLHQAGENWPAAVSLGAALAAGLGAENSVADRLAAVLALASDCAAEIFAPTPLVTGDDLRRQLRLQPGPEFGRILATLYRQQIEGEIKSRDQALEIAARLRTGREEEQ